METKQELLNNLNLLNSEIRELQNKIKPIESKRDDIRRRLLELSNFNLRDKVCYEDNYGNTETAFISSVGILADGSESYKLNKPKKDGSMSLVEDHSWRGRNNLRHYALTTPNSK